MNASGDKEDEGMEAPLATQISINKKAPTFVPEEVFYEPEIKVGTPY